MNTFKKNTPLVVTWEILGVSGSPISLTGKTFKFKYKTSRGENDGTSDCTINPITEASLEWVFPVAKQMYCGVYSLELSIYHSDGSPLGRFIYDNAFLLSDVVAIKTSGTDTQTESVAGTGQALVLTSYSSVSLYELDAAEADRQAAFKTNESERQSTFETNEAARYNTFTHSEDSQQSIFNTSETNRKSTFEANESKRQSTFTTNEKARQVNEDVRQAAEAERQSIFEDGETARQKNFETNEKTRQTNESARVIAEENRTKEATQVIAKCDTAATKADEARKAIEEDAAVVKTSAQTLTDELQEQVRKNISAVSSADMSQAKADIETLQTTINDEMANGAELAAAVARIVAALDRFGDVKCLSISSKDIPMVCDKPFILYGSGVPSADVVPDNWDKTTMGEWTGVPTFIGQHYINVDASEGGEYYARGTSSVSDWRNK